MGSNQIRLPCHSCLPYRGTYPCARYQPGQLAQLFSQNEGTILGLFNMFSGGALERMSVLALGIMPYSASIIMQLMTIVSPQLETAEEGR